MLYLCDPDKNVDCPKTVCQSYCKNTTKQEFAKLDENGLPITENIPSDFLAEK